MAAERDSSRPAQRGDRTGHRGPRLPREARPFVPGTAAYAVARVQTTRPELPGTAGRGHTAEVSP